VTITTAQTTNTELRKSVRKTTSAEERLLRLYGNGMVAFTSRYEDEDGRRSPLLDVDEPPLSRRTLKACGKLTRRQRGVPTHPKGISSMTTRSKEVLRWLR